MPVSPQYDDLKSEINKLALLEVFEAHVLERYTHLDGEQLNELRQLIRDYSHTLVVDGAAPSTIKGDEFDIDLKPGAIPVRHQLPRLSPQEQLKEQHHVRKEEALGHLSVPTDAKKSEWITKTHIVSKKDDEWGRWICDFRFLDAAVAKHATALGDVFTKTRALAAKKRKSGLDAWSGFSQMAASE